VVRLTEQFLKSDPIRENEYKRTIEAISETLKDISIGLCSGTLLRSWKIPVEKSERVAVDQSGLVYIICDRASQLFIFDLK
jgi:hypothetical protein